MGKSNLNLNMVRLKLQPDEVARILALTTPADVDISS